MEKSPLNDPEVYPEEAVLADLLGSSFPVFQRCMTKISGEPLMLSPEWRYYNDGHAWLCKVIHKKKTVFWLSVWEGCFKTTFYFTEKTGAGVADLGIDPVLLEKFRSNKPIGRLIPLTISVQDEAQLNDLVRIAEYKKKLK
jgi:hypothetical protein